MIRETALFAGSPLLGRQTEQPGARSPRLLSRATSIGADALVTSLYQPGNSAVTCLTGRVADHRASSAFRAGALVYAAGLHRLQVGLEYGAPDGTPVVYCHGLPGSRIDGRVTADVNAEAGVRMIAPDRPGFGLSSMQRGKRSYAGWPTDVEHLVDALDVERFAVVGYSCGGPYALAAAALLRDRVSRVAVVSGVAPSEMPGYRKGIASTDRAMLLLSLRAPWLARVLMGRALKQARDRPERFAKSLDRDFSAPADQDVLESGLRAVLPELFREAGRNGSDGMVEDYAVWARPSGLALDQIDVPVLLWHGDDDRSIAISHSRWVASRTPKAELKIWGGIGHLHTPDRWREVLEALA